MKERTSNRLKGLGAYTATFLLTACAVGAPVDTPKLDSPDVSGQSSPEPNNNTTALLDQYLKPQLYENVDKQFIAMAIRFWLETYTTKENPVELHGRTWQVETNVDDWIENVPKLLSPELKNDHWASWTPEAETVFEATCKWSENDGENGEYLIQKKYVKFGALSNTSFSQAQIENGMQRVEAIYFDYIYRTKENGEEWTEWRNSTGTNMYQYEVRNDVVTMMDNRHHWTNTATSPINFSNNPSQERPECEE